MTRRVVYEFALVALLLILAIFFFPAVSGPYPVVHGPATALRALQAWRLLLFLLGLSLLGFSLPRRSTSFAVFSFSQSFKPLDPLHQSALLRL